MSDDEIKNAPTETDHIDDEGNESTPTVGGDEPVDEKSDIDRELERVESIEHRDLSDEPRSASDDTLLAADEASPSEVKTSDDTSAESPQRVAPVVLPVSLPEDNNKKVNLDDIIKRNKVEQTAKKKPIVWIVLVVVFVIVAAALGAAYYMKTLNDKQQLDSLQSKYDSAAATNQSLTKQLSAAKKEVTAAAEAAKKAATETAQASASEYREIPEWGVRYKVTDSNKELTYAYRYVGSSDKDGVTDELDFSTTTIAKTPASADNLKAGAVAYPCQSGASFMWMKRYTKEQLAAAKKSVAGSVAATMYDNAIQNGNYYYLTGRAQDNCSSSVDEKLVAATLTTLKALPSAFEAIPMK